ncbi:uncharacterized protein STEHIDRAFT_153300 [Stereum hirsutum FP-91666 SS1]|uniref:uncharacterized protein n=1 Tax=Stereum hirsutum (strain FP-91666) TaxID=721885 RepID=UPI000440D719|nr:uncharacterized protein STEHIDRAFT_153300 [Stereum hirsutum FP-91666 SS1]EIM91679.1 hypothetical protein STEHIDRAFT_153300 [Stereum hirsutum FP-91666 SS1]
MFGVYAPAFPLKTENESVEEELIKEIPAEVVENGPLAERNVVLANAFKCMQEEVEKDTVESFEHSAQILNDAVKDATAIPFTSTDKRADNKADRGLRETLRALTDLERDLRKKLVVHEKHCERLLSSFTAVETFIKNECSSGQPDGPPVKMRLY